MTKTELDELLSDCPTLFHMAESGSWPSIRVQGLLSTTALLDLYEITGEQRMRIEEQRRPEGITITHPKFPRAVVRDQIPMTDEGLLRCLPKHMRTSDWYRLLNSKVFFWLTRQRLLTLLNAGAYRKKSHDVITVASRPLVEAYHDKIWLSPINSGCTKPFPHPRDEKTFRRIAEYPYAEWRQKRGKGERVVELAVEYAIPDMRNFVTGVVEMRGSDELRTIYKR